MTHIIRKTKCTTLIFFWTLLISLPTLSHGAIYYVDGSSGTDTANNCSKSSSPCKSISHAVAVVPAGTSSANIISVAVGTYSPDTTGESFPITIAKNNLTLQGVSLSSIIDSNNTDENIIVIDGKNITIDRFTFRNIATRSIYIRNRGVTVQNNIFEDSVYHGTWVAISQHNISTNISMGSINILNNSFSTSHLGFLISEDYEFDPGTQSLQANIGDLRIEGNSFTGIQEGAIKINEISTKSMNEGTLNFGNLTISDNIFTDCDHNISMKNIFINSMDSTTVTVGNFNLSNNTIHYSNTPITVGDGIILEDLLLISDIYNNSSITTGTITIVDNDIKSFENPLKLTMGDIRDIGSLNGGDTATINRGAKNILRNNVTSMDGNAVTINFANIGNEQNGDTSIILGPLTMSDNVFTGASEGLYFHFDSVGANIANTATTAFSPFSFENNTLTGITPTRGTFVVEYETGTIGKNIARSARVTLPDWRITNNTIHIEGNGDGFQFRSSENPSNVVGRVDFGNIAMESNVINRHNNPSLKNGVQIALTDFGSSLENNSIVNHGNISISDNEINTPDNSGVLISVSNVGFGALGNYEITLGDIALTNNSVNYATNGLYVNYTDIHGQTSGSVTLGTLDILGNTLSAVRQHGAFSSTETNHSSGSASMAIGKTTISGNTITASSGTPENSSGIELIGNFQSTVTSSAPEVNDNNISDFHAGLSVKNFNRLNLTCNTFARNSNSGVLLNTNGTITASSNALIDNGFGIRLNTTSTATVKAENNWWGNPAGPIACVSCNTIYTRKGGIDVTPWLTSVPDCSPLPPKAPFPWPLFVTSSAVKSNR